MKQLSWIALGMCLLIGLMGPRGTAQTASSPPASPPTLQPSTPTTRTNTTPAATYTLSPERRAKAIAYSHARYALYFAGTLYSLCIYVLLWRTGIAVTLRNFARKTSRRLSLQTLLVVPPFVAAAMLLGLPLDFYSGYIVEHRYGLATQGLGFWFADWMKGIAITVVGGVILAWIFYTVVRRSPRRWWFYFWLASIPLILGLILIEPYVVEPLFYKFVPLENTQPALVKRIEIMLRHGGLSIPPERIFESNASSRTNEVDAYVSGLGSSKRVVVWDTTLQKMTPDELLLVLGHETGHYVLHHIPKEFVLDEVVALVFFFLGFLAVRRLVEKCGARTGIEGIGDLASTPVTLLVLTLLVFFSAPVVNAISRYYEHQADQFGLEVAYGVVPDPNAAEIAALQVLGKEDLADPDPGAFIKFWLYTHPPLEDRIRFADRFRPWAQGKPLELLPKAQ